MSPTDKTRGKILAQFSKQMKKKGLYAVGLGGGEKDGKINLIDITFNIHQVMNIKSARKLIVESSNDLLTLINSNDLYADYFIQNPVPIKLICISIIGNTPSTSGDYIRSVFILKGKVYYCKDDPEKKIMPFITAHVETFEEAVQILAEQEKCEQCA